jgi:hypothetical protein
MAAGKDASAGFGAFGLREFIGVSDIDALLHHHHKTTGRRTRR